MKDRNTKPNWTQLNKTVQRAELQFREAQGRAKKSELQSRLAKHKHKQARQSARLAKKEAKRWKVAFREARCVLETAEATLKKARKEITRAKEHQHGAKSRAGSTLHLQVRKKSRTWKRAAANSRTKPLGQEQIALNERPSLKHHIEAPAAPPVRSSQFSRPVVLPTV